MKTVYRILAFSLLMMSCQSNKEGTDNLNAIVEKQSKEATTKPQSNTILTEAQFNNFFPKEIGDYKLVNVSVLMSSAVASAMYIKDNDYKHSMTYSLEDCNRKGSANIRNFEDSYKLKPQGPLGTEYVYKERDGYKTIAFLQPNIKRNNIGFIYNNRFRIVLNGTADVDVLWTYFKKEDLKKLNN
ncbi:hypothetical protein [Formosa sp. PL04]|uniref:hypothetical protein n=1 Tax=Formosa sp. PL04 TaxID=3081755 RepID=UPI002981A35D|nr:hypothetical protein [Formosa sp. PL04]MDW5290226.1 hypothetical protein [Formosa sp. PL04]